MLIPVYAAPFDSNAESALESFAEIYGWDLSKNGDVVWIGDDGEYHTRQSNGFQDEYYQDMIKVLADEYNIKLTSESNGSGLSIVSVALAEVEAEDSMETPLGSNIVKYNDWYYNRHVGGEDYPWCAVFVSWCAEQCGLIDAGVFPRTAGVRNAFQFFIDDCGFDYYSASEIAQFGGSYSAVPGDIFFFQSNAHIGIVTAVGENYIEVTQGNTSDRVLTIRYTSGSLYSSVRYGNIVHVEYPSAQDTIFWFFVKQVGCSPAAACGILANIEAESGNFNINAIGDNGTSFGICQWHNERWTRLSNFCAENGYDEATLDGQLMYLWWELQYTNEVGTYNAIMAAGNTTDDVINIARFWCTNFERPADPYGASNYRASIAIGKYWPLYSDVEWP